MILNSLTKVSIGGGSVLGTVYLGDTLIDNNQERKIFQKTMEKVDTVDDMELLEAMKGCTLNFVDSWNNNRTYRANKFYSELRQDKKEQFKNKMVETVNKKISECKPGVSFSFSWKMPYNDFFNTDYLIG